MTRLGAELATRGWLLRSGGSPGADRAFEQGCDQATGRKEIYLPWKGFNGSDSPLFDMPAGAMTIALRIHRGLHKRSSRVRQLRARNVCQILGASLNDSSKLVIAWTERALPSGGSATVLTIAGELGIPVLNLAAPDFAQLDCDAILARIIGTAGQSVGGDRLQFGEATRS